MKLCGYLVERNESSRGHLRRCLEHMARYCDAIAVYDDGSTDDSVSVAREYTQHVIEGPGMGLSRETTYRQHLLDYIHRVIEPDFIWWLDADEVLDRAGEEGGLRQWCEDHPHEAGRAEEITLWRSASWRRLDYLGRGMFTRLWPASRAKVIPQEHGLHRRLYPLGLHGLDLPFQVIHYGYDSREKVERRWVERTALGVPQNIRAQCIDERGLQLERVPVETFPWGLEPDPEEPMPTPIEYRV